MLKYPDTKMNCLYKFYTKTNLANLWKLKIKKNILIEYWILVTDPGIKDKDAIPAVVGLAIGKLNLYNFN